MSSTLASTRRAAYALGLAVAGLLLSGSAWAQSGRSTGSPQEQAAYAEWRKLSQREVNCVDKALKERGSSLWSAIQRGIDPASSRVASLRADCRGQARTPAATASVQSGSQALAREPTTDKAAAEKTVAERAAADQTQAEKVAADNAAAEKVAAEKAAADKAKAERAVAERAAVEKAQAEKVAAEKDAAEKAAAEKAAAEKAAADKAKAETAPVVQASADKARAEKPAAEKAAAESVELELPKADSERAKTESAKTQPNANGFQQVAAEKPVDIVFATAMAEARTSFAYGLITGPILFCLGGLVTFFLQRRRLAVQVDAVEHKVFDRLAAAVVAEQRRVDRIAPRPSAPTPEPSSGTDQRIGEAALH
jgi:hypothetical protein